MASSSEEEESSHGKKTCIMHVNKEIKGVIKECTDKGWNKFLECARSWVKFDVKEGEIAEEVASRAGFDLNVWTCMHCSMCCLHHLHDIL